MHSSLSRFAAACLALVALTSSASAATILQFGQQFPTDFVTATNAAGVTTLSTNSGLVPGSIPVTITNIGGAPVAILANETFTALSASGGATSAAGTTMQSGYGGTIAITAGAINYLTITFTGGTMSGPTGGNSGALSASQPPNNVTFTSNFAPVIVAMGGPSSPGAFALSFSGLAPGLGVTGGSLSSFTAQNTGTFSSAPAIPEPASIVMASISVFAGLGCFGWRRLSASRA